MLVVVIIIAISAIAFNFLLPILIGSDLSFGTRVIINSYLLLVFSLAVAGLFHRKYLKQIVLISITSICTLTILFAGSELYISLQKKNIVPGNNYDLSTLEKYYDEFRVQCLHPYYIFFLPYEGSLLKKINNSVCSIDRNGFRGKGPEERGKRKLAFLLGGSSAFGLDASSNDTTITGYLNKNQSQYFFVNAGVPGWNSMQELYRVLLQIIEYNPDLIVVHDGHNDASISYKQAKSGYEYLVGTPDSFDALAERVDDIRSKGKNLIDININYRKLLVKISALCFPELRSYISKQMGKSYSQKSAAANLPLREITEKGGGLDDFWRGKAEATAKNYLQNLSLMQAVCRERKIKIIFIFQPYLFGHKNKAQCLKEYLNRYERIDADKINYINKFHEIVVDNSKTLERFYDLYNLFDKYFQDIPGGVIFTDEVHLYDRGNEIVAKEVINTLN